MRAYELWYWAEIPGRDEFVRLALEAGSLAYHPQLMALRERVRGLPELAAYLASERRIGFNRDGIFRHYPELDSA